MTFLHNPTGLSLLHEMQFAVCTYQTTLVTIKSQGNKSAVGMQGKSALGTSPTEKAFNIVFIQRLEFDETKKVSQCNTLPQEMYTQSIKLCTESIRQLSKVWAMSIYMDYTPTRGWLEPTPLPECFGAAGMQ